MPIFGAGKSVLGMVADETISANEFRFRGFITNFRITKNLVDYITDFTPSITLPAHETSTEKSLVDPGNNLIIGNFIGSLDEITLFDGVASDSMIQMLRESATQVAPSVPREAKTYFGMGKTRSSSTGQYVGLGKIWGNVTDREGNPLSRKVVLIEYWSYVPITEVVSDPLTGYYEFLFLDTNALFSVVAEDFRDYRYNDIIRGKIHAEVK